MGQDYVWPQESIAYSTQLIESLGGEVVGTEFVPIGGTNDWGPILGRIRDADPDVYFPFIGGDDLIANLKSEENRPAAKWDPRLYGIGWTAPNFSRWFALSYGPPLVS